MTIYFWQDDSFSLNPFRKIDTYWQNPPLAIEIVLLAMSSETETPDRARALLDRSEQDDRRQDILELISTIMVYRFPKLGWEAVAMMLDIQDIRLEDTRAYQEIAEKQGQSVRVSIVMRQLTELIGNLSDVIQAKISTLTLEQLEELSLALLQFKKLRDLEAWLSEHR
jgi:predicted transposase YdaD